MLDLVYVYKNTPENDSDELRYSLRSLQNLPHRNVYVVGEKPDWLQKAIHIPVVQTSDKGQSVSRNILTAINIQKLSDDFVLMNDDFFVMKPIAEVPTLHWGPVKVLLDRMYERYNEVSNYMQRMKQLYDLLQANGYQEPLSYELHVPMVLNKQRVAAMYDPSFGPIYQFRSMYGNAFAIGGDYSDDVKVYLDSRHNSATYVRDAEGYLESRTFLSATAGAFATGKIGEYVRRQFPDKSPYEV